MISMSQTQLKDARKCEVYFKRAHIDKEQVSGMESSAMYYGTSFHAGLRAYLEGDNGVEAFKALWSMWEKKEVEGRFKWAELQDQAVVLLDRFERLHLKKFGKAIKLEERLYGEFMGRPFEGTPDFVGEYQGKPSVIDFKTSYAPYPKGKASISEQLYLYAYLARQQLGYECNQIGYLVFVKGTTPSISTQMSEYSEIQSEKILRSAIELSRRMEQSERGQRPFMPNWDSCIQGERRCPFFDKCHALLVDQISLTKAA